MMTLRIFVVLVAGSLFLGASGSGYAAEQVTAEVKSDLEMRTPSFGKNKEYKPKKRKKANRKKRGGCEAYG